mmetsp:Transcript_37422/g.99001  ORF Transcript_37422/g.99001 Transcript_37422/m.99001 type:complete len:258 (-) Transcript_37422:315-1088(-)
MAEGRPVSGLGSVRIRTRTTSMCGARVTAEHFSASMLCTAMTTFDSFRTSTVTLAWMSRRFWVVRRSRSMPRTLEARRQVVMYCVPFARSDVRIPNVACHPLILMSIAAASGGGGGVGGPPSANGEGADDVGAEDVEATRVDGTVEAPKNGTNASALALPTSDAPEGDDSCSRAAGATRGGAGGIPCAGEVAVAAGISMSASTVHEGIKTRPGCAAGACASIFTAHSELAFSTTAAASSLKPERERGWSPEPPARER